MDVSALPASTPVWLVVAGVIISFALTLSERAAKLAGPLGAAARWWQGRQRDEVARDRGVAAEIEEAVRERVEAHMSVVSGQIAEMRARIATLQEDLATERAERRAERTAEQAQHRADMAAMRWERDLMAAWASHLQSWFFPVRQWLDSLGLEVPPPPFPSFDAFRRSWQKDHPPPGLA